MISKEILGTKWFILEKLYKYPPINLAPVMELLEYHLAAYGLKNIGYSINEYKNGETKMLLSHEDWHATAKDFLTKIINDPTIADKAHDESDTVLVPAIRAASQKIIGVDLKTKTNEELVALHTELSDLMGRLQTVRCLAWIMETSGEYFSGYLIGYLRDLFAQHGIHDDPVLTFAALTNQLNIRLSTSSRLVCCASRSRSPSRISRLMFLNPQFRSTLSFTRIFHLVAKVRRGRQPISYSM